MQFLHRCSQFLFRISLLILNHFYLGGISIIGDRWGVWDQMGIKYGQEMIRIEEYLNLSAWKMKLKQRKICTVKWSNFATFSDISQNIKNCYEQARWFPVRVNNVFGQYSGGHSICI